MKIAFDIIFGILGAGCFVLLVQIIYDILNEK
jgi:hypothetical protein